MRHQTSPITTLVVAILPGLAATVASAQGRPAGGGSANPSGTPQEYSATEPSWSRDGKSIAFASDRAGNDEIYVMNSDGSNIRRVTNTPDEEHYPVWSPDGRQIAFYGSPNGKGGIYVMNADGSSRRLVATTSTAGDNPNRPTWSPDGKRLAFVAGEHEGGQIMLVNVDGTGLAKLAGTRPGDGMPAWSPDGDRIAFVTQRGGNADILIAAVDGAGIRRVTRDTVDEMSPTWSADGKRIAFMADAGGHNRELFIATLDSGDAPVNVSRDPDWEAYPEWSGVDPNLILEVRLSDGVVGIYLVDIRGGAPKWLTGPRR